MHCIRAWSCQKENVVSLKGKVLSKFSLLNCECEMASDTSQYVEAAIPSCTCMMVIFTHVINIPSPRKIKLKHFTII